MKIRFLMAALALALANTAEATPVVSGDGACGVRAVDNESFLTCDGDRAPEPAAAAESPAPDNQDGTPSVTLSCRLLDGTRRQPAVAGPGLGDAVILVCRTGDVSRLAAKS
jgi:hypothetical protein